MNVKKDEKIIKARLVYWERNENQPCYRMGCPYNSIKLFVSL